MDTLKTENHQKKPAPAVVIAVPPMCDVVPKESFGRRADVFLGCDQDDSSHVRGSHSPRRGHMFNKKSQNDQYIYNMYVCMYVCMYIYVYYIYMYIYN